MTEQENQKYPLRTIHEFVSAINREWGTFKRGSVISILISAVLLVVFGLVFWRTVRLGFETSDVILELLLAAFLVYNIYLMLHQFRFYRKWENRMKRLETLEEKLLTEKLDEK